MKQTPARSHFKTLMGQTNHFIITARVGLWAIEERPDDFSVPEEMHAAWNPRNKKESAKRTEAFILRSSLAWTVTCLDSYFTRLNRAPKYLQDTKLIDEFDSAGHSVLGKFRALNRFF